MSVFSATNALSPALPSRLCGNYTIEYNCFCRIFCLGFASNKIIALNRLPTSSTAIDPATPTTIDTGISGSDVFVIQ
jgi:hypothetical protein